MTRPRDAVRSETSAAFASSRQHLLAELERIDLLIAAEVARARRLHASDEQFRGLYISEEEVDALLRRPVGQPRWAGAAQADAEPKPGLDEIGRVNRARRDESVRRGVELRLDRLQQHFGLDAFEVDVVLVCLAVEMDLRYEKLYAYLNDDVTKKRPTVGLVLDLLAPAAEARLGSRRYFGAEASLFRHHLLTLFEDPSQPHPPLLAKYIAVDPRIVRYLLDTDAVDERIRACVSLLDPEAGPDRWPVDDATRRQLVRFVQDGATDGPAIIHLRGPYGAGKQGVAEAVCRDLGRRLLVVDVAKMSGDKEGGPPTLFELVQREVTLQGAAVFWKSFDALLAEDRKAGLAAFLDALSSRPALTFLAGEVRWEPSESLRTARLARVELTRPSWSERMAMWSAALDGDHRLEADVDLGALAATFKFTGGQIRDAAAMAVNLARLRDSGPAGVGTADLYEASRLQSNQKLSTLARKIVPKYTWSDIVLPRDHVERLQEICNHVKYRERVLRRLGLRSEAVAGQGAERAVRRPVRHRQDHGGRGHRRRAGPRPVQDRPLGGGQQVHRRDREEPRRGSSPRPRTPTRSCSSTRPTRCSASAPRSSDAHDRYANIEITYLLQRMEEYDGLVDPGHQPAQEHRRGVRAPAALHRRVPVPRRGATGGASGRASGRPQTAARAGPRPRLPGAPASS